MSSALTSESVLASLRSLLAGAELRDQFLPPLSDREIEAVERLLPAVWDATQRWISQFPILDAESALPASILKIAQLRTLAAEDIATAVTWELWVQGLDDVFDQRQRPFDELCATVEECCGIAIAAAGSERVETLFGESLLEVKRSLARHPTFPDLQPAFAATLSRLLEGLLYTYGMSPGTAAGGAPRVPGFEEYLYHASRTFLHPFIWSLPLYDDPTVVQGLPGLARLADQCSRVLRLANDLGTCEREEREGVVNAVALKAAHFVCQDPGQPEATRHQKALDWVRERVGAESPRAYALLRRVSTASRAETDFVRLMELSRGIYERRDLRAWHRQLEECQTSGGR